MTLGIAESGTPLCQQPLNAIHFEQGELRTAQERQTTVGFWKGAIIGGIAGVAYGIWTAPQSGAELRESLTTNVENTLFRLTGMDVWRPEQANPATWSATAANPADWETEQIS